MKKNGYTLIELIVTIALIAIAATVIMANMVGMRDNQANDNFKKYKKTIETAACVYIDMYDNGTLRETCKSSATGCEIPLYKLIGDEKENTSLGLLDPDLKDPKTKCTASAEKSRVSINVKFVASTVNGKTVYEKKCEMNNPVEMCK